MILSFLGNIDFAGILIILVPVAIIVFISSKRFFTKRFKTDDREKVISWSILSTLLLSPIATVLILVLFILLMIWYENVQ